MTAGRPSPWLLGPVLTALALFALAHRDALFASLCALLLLGAYGHRRTLPEPTLQRWPRLLGMALLAWGLSWAYYATVLQAGHALVYFPRLYYKPVFITTSGMLLALALVWLWHLPRLTSRTNGYIFMGAGLLVIASGNLLALPSLYRPCLVLFLGTTLLALCVLSGIPGGLQRPGKARMWQALLLLGCALLVGAGTWGLSSALQGLQSIISAAIIEMMQGGHSPAGLGIGDRLRIERHRRVALTHTMVLTLSGATPPGYLRTQVMSQYHNGLWKSAPALTPSASPGTTVQNVHNVQVELPSEAGTGRLEHLASPLTPPPSTARRTVTLLADLRGIVPLPYTAHRMTTSASVVCMLTSGTILHCTPAERLLRYSVTGHAVPARPAYRLAATPEAREEVQQAREAPEAVLVPLRALAQQVVGPYSNVPLAAARLLQEYFRRYYTYSLQVDLADHGDPIVDFVLHRRPAYCEYYAAGLTLMLRALDIPARVVGGFAVHEYNPLAGQWIVRQRDAHAWTEVFDTLSQTWVVFDATPLDSGPSQAVAGGPPLLTQSWVWLTVQAQRFLVWTRTAEPQRWFDDLGALGRSLLRQPLSWLLLGGGVSLWLGMTQRRRLWKGRRRAPGGEQRTARVLDATAVEAQRLFGQVARALAEHGRPIGAAETLEEYLQRSQERQSEGVPEDVSSPPWALSWHPALAQFAQVYTVLRFHHPGAAAPDPATPPAPSLALLRYRAAQVLAALRTPSS